MAPLWLLLASLAVYSVNLQRIASGDTVGASLVPFALWLDGTVTLERFTAHVPEHARAFVWKDGRAYSAYPIALPILITPLYGPAAWLAGSRGWNSEQTVVLAAILEKVSASVIAALSVALFYLFVRRLTSGKRAILLALVYGLGTNTWVTSSQALWQHGGSEIAVIAGLWSLWRAHRSPAGRLPVLAAGLCAAVAVAVRPTNILFLAAVGAWLAVARRGWIQWAIFLAAPLCAGGLTLAYNLYVFGRPSGGNALDFDGAFWSGLAGVLASPSRGLFVYTPVVFFSLVGAWAWWNSREKRRESVYLVSALFCASQIFLVSHWRVWWGGHCFGPRLLTDIVPCLVLLILPGAEWLSKRRFTRAAFAAAVAVSLFVQATGAFCYPRSEWDVRPVPVGEHPSRLWDWSDNPILRGLRAGPRIGPGHEARQRIKHLFLNQ
ncbi:MAG: hypothetical protein ACE141_00250 [Bryobacteraceae bacterium]